MLIVDDEPTLLSVTRRLLRRHSVTTASTVAQVVAILDAGAPFDLVLCDLSMPGESGADFLRHVEGRFPALMGRVIIMSGGAAWEEAADFLAALPADRVLAKPFTSAQLEALVVRFARS